jgi:hypothetical protein
MQAAEGALSSSEEGSSLDEPTWVSWFCMLRNHEFFCEVDPAFVQDRFNLYGLKEVVGPLYGEAMTMILGYAPTGEPRGLRASAPRAPPPRAAHADAAARRSLALRAEKQLADPTQRVHKVRRRPAWRHPPGLIGLPALQLCARLYRGPRRRIARLTGTLITARRSSTLRASCTASSTRGTY